MEPPLEVDAADLAFSILADLAVALAVGALVAEALVGLAAEVLAAADLEEVGKKTCTQKSKKKILITMFDIHK